MSKCWGALLVAVVVVATALAACAPRDPGGGDPSTTTTTAPSTSTTVPATTTTAAPTTTTTTAPPAEAPGLTNPALLTDYTGPSTISSGTVVIENKRITGRLTIDGGNVTIRNSLIEFEDWYHGIEIYGGSDIVVRSNTIVVTGGEGETGCVNIATDFGNIDNVLVEDNDMTGGTATLYVRLQGQGESVTDVRVRDNRFHLPHIYHTHSVDPRSAVVEWTGNTLDGAPLDL